MSDPRGSGFRSRFGSAPSGSAEAPGRVNLIGEHTDYNGGWVFPAAVELKTHVGVRFRRDTRVRGVSASRGESAAELAEPARGDWLDYVRGIARELVRAGELPELGFDLAVRSDVPEGAGLSSSGALLVATGLALRSAAGIPERPVELSDLARACQRAESSFVGTPCGIMDPFVSLHARAGHALLLRCTDLTTQQIPVPEALELVVVDSGVEHTLRAGGYAARTREADRALAECRRVLGLSLRDLSELSEAALPALEQSLDALSFRRVRHVVTENARVRAMARALPSGDFEAVSQCLYASHESLQRDYQVTCPETDWLVAHSRGLRAVVGARMTGAGWGGCTVHLTRAPDGEQVAQALSSAFEARFGRRPRHWVSRPEAGARLTHSPDGPAPEPVPGSRPGSEGPNR